MRMGRFLTIAYLALCITACAGSTNFGDFVGKETPFARFAMLDGGYESTETLRGKTVILIFWATTCTASRSVVERINEIAVKNSKRKDVVFLAISIDKADDVEKLNERIKFGKLTGLKHVFSGNDVYDEAFMAFQLDSLPAVFVIDRSGKIRAGGRSASLAEDYLKRL